MTQPPMPQAGVPTCYRHPGRESHIRCQRCSRPICPDCMRDAAVGFQCPECVAEGRRTTRQARTAYGGLRPTNASITTMVLIGLNVAVFGMIQLTGRYGSRLYELFALTPTGTCSVSDGSGYFPGVTSEGLCSTVAGTRWVPGVVDGSYWQLVTTMFTHVEIWHIGLNMLALYMLGPQIELAVGRIRFLALYLLSGLAGSALVYWLADPEGSTVGASTAVFGLMGALLVIAHKVGGDVQQILLLLAVNAVITFTIPNVSWPGHLGGFLGGVVISGVLVYAPRGPRRAAFQACGLVTVTALLALAVIARSAALA
ncbi:MULTISPECIES: rhomboid family intramembrane serine protease [unclassified Nocardioides]|uniref:rhomboid family intramembrane serine protease n=1 Tax=unclassified Nocardioides TaxID=2615069 RepID=UPI0030146297